MNIVSKFVLWTLAPETDMPLEMMEVTILWAICKPCCYNRFAMPEVSICTVNIVIPACGAGIRINGGWLECPPELFAQHLSECVPLLIQPLLRDIAVPDWNR